jgi:diaminopimelate epimerase
MLISFNKYQGTGNDFVIIDNRDQFFNHSESETIRLLCDRRFGIGADGLILLETAEGYDFRMIYFNSDGTESTMCGNGGRCVTAFAQKIGLLDKAGTFMAADGIHYVRIHDDLVSLSMKDVDPPVTIKGYHFLDTGSPHYIIPVPDCSTVDVGEKGGELRNSDLFAPGGTNVNFVEKTDNGIFVRTFERGVEDETLSCGTGITASAISSRWGSPDGDYAVRVETRGGTLAVNFNLSSKKVTNICLQGPAEFVFEGKIEI